MLKANGCTSDVAIVRRACGSVISRRSMLEWVGAASLPLIGACSSLPRVMGDNYRPLGAPPTVSAWLDDAMLTKNLEGALLLGKFPDSVYYVAAQTKWSPKKRPSAVGSDVVVPKGFITDLASIPPIFFPLFRPDGQYAHAAVVHDYMYWTQQESRGTSDEVFREAMEFLEVSPATVKTLFQAVRTFGSAAWDENRARKARGEKRVLRVFPSDPRITWAAWQAQPNVFEAE